MASEIRRQVQQETGLTCSVGQGPNTLISKVASDMNKPNGQFVVENDGQAVARFIQELPIRKVPGIGRVGPFQLHWLRPACPAGRRLEDSAAAQDCVAFSPAGLSTKGYAAGSRVSLQVIGD